MKQYDIIVVGTGGATIVADAALKKGLKVAIIEKGKFGGTCLNRGCIPTKVMVTAANAIQEVEEMCIRDSSCSMRCCTSHYMSPPFPEVTEAFCRVP